jgi:hypothetical protein
MRLAASQDRALDRIERTLLADDPRLGSLFAVFTRLTRHEAMPATEQVRAGRWRPQGPVAAVSIALVILAGAVALALSAPSGQTCGATVTSSARSYTPSQAPGCPAPTQQWRYLR